MMRHLPKVLRSSSLIIGTLLLIGASIPALEVFGKYWALKINEGIEDAYFPYISDSIADSKKREIFISSLVPENFIVQNSETKYEIQEAWLEEKVYIEFTGSPGNFYRRIKSLGNYRLMIRFNQPISDHHIITCNNSIGMQPVSAPNMYEPMIQYAELEAPLPDHIQCKISDSGVVQSLL